MAYLAFKKRKDETHCHKRHKILIVALRKSELRKEQGEQTPNHGSGGE
jgi:hypothetical protein